MHPEAGGAEPGGYEHYNDARNTQKRRRHTWTRQKMRILSQPEGV